MSPKNECIAKKPKCKARFLATLFRLVSFRNIFRALETLTKIINRIPIAECCHARPKKLLSASGRSNLNHTWPRGAAINRRRLAVLLLNQRFNRMHQKRFRDGRTSGGVAQTTIL